jgi:hypothetical protein
MSSESLHAFREIVSDVFRLAMQAAAGKYRECPESFDRFLCTAMSLIESKENMKHTHSYLEKSMTNAVTEALLGRADILPTPDPPHLIIHPINEAGEDIIPNVVVTKDSYSENSSVIVEPVEAEDSNAMNNVNEETEEAAEDAEEEAVESEEAEEDAVESEEAEEDAVESEEAEEAEEEAVEAPEETEEAAEEAEETEEAAEEAEETEEAAEDAEETEEAAEDAEETEEAAEEAEDDDFDIQKIGKKKYFVGKPTNRVYVFVSEDEYGDCIGKLENGKIVPI